MPLPKRCDKCGKKYIPNSYIQRCCEECIKQTKILNGKMRNETFKNFMKLNNITYRRI
jgi:uncharacterized OB-fold protein